MKERNWTDTPAVAMTQRAMAIAATIAWGAFAYQGCGGDNSMDAPMSAETSARGAGTGVGQSGAQDFGRFRSIIENGEVPAPNTLDVVGFFNEHKIELPAPDCGERVCLHGMMGVQGNMINGANCTVVMIGFNTDLVADDFERPPLNLAIAVDVSGSMIGPPIEAVRLGLLQLATTLDAKDTISLIEYSAQARLVLESSPENDPDRAQLTQAIRGLNPGGETNIYAGLRMALDQVLAQSDASRQNRVIFLSDGSATSGIVSTDRIVNLAESYTSQGIGITSVGVGTDFDIDLMRRLSETGPGNFYFLEDLNSVEEVFVHEINTFMVPLAEEIDIEFYAGQGYSFRAAYGTRTWEGDASGATISIPGLFMASRNAPDDIDPGGGRRGGGGMILLELVPTSDEALLSELQPGATTGELFMRYRKPGTELFVEQRTTITNPLAPGDTPDAGQFESTSVEKAFVTLNIFAGLQMAVERFAQGSPNSALNVLIPLRDNVSEWLLAQTAERVEADPDIQADLEVVDDLIELMEADRATEEVGAPPNPWPQD